MRNVSRPHDWLVCLITDVAGAGDETKHLVTQISAHNDVLTVFISDPLEAQLPDVGKAVFSFGDRKIEVDASSTSCTSRFATTRAEWSARVTRPVATPRDSGPADLDGKGRRRSTSRADRSRRFEAQREPQMTDDAGRPRQPSRSCDASGNPVLATRRRHLDPRRRSLAILAIVAWRVFMTYRADAYRRAALAEVDALEHALQGGSLRSQAIPTRPSLRS